MSIDTLFNKALKLLRQLIATPSLGREEGKTADIILQFLSSEHISASQHLNNVWCVNKFYDAARPTILLNSHHDTVKPNSKYTRDPFGADVEDGRLYGLGSNDAGGCLVSLIVTFLHFYGREDLRYNLVLAATAEEEISGKNGIEALLPLLPPFDAAIVGEPTMTNLAIAEKGLLVLDCVAQGEAGHAARNEGVNAIYKAMEDIRWFQSFLFPRVSQSLGPIKMTVSVIDTENKAHNVVPASCHFVVDVRVTDEYSHEEILDIIKRSVTCEVTPRSMRMRSSKIAINHPLVAAGLNLGKTTYGSPTTSDQALISVPSLKCGPGDSARSHTADEYIFVREIREGIETYINLLTDIL